jgi:hypothetical protein
VAFGVFLLAPKPSRAEQAQGAGLDPAAAQGLSQTQALLVNPSARRQAIDANPKAKATAAGIGNLIGHDPNAEQALYEEASSILATLVAEANGDPEKLRLLVEELKNNPSALESRLSAEQKKGIRDLANKAATAPAARANNP